MLRSVIASKPLLFNGQRLSPQQRVIIVTDTCFSQQLHLRQANINIYTAFLCAVIKTYDQKKIHPRQAITKCLMDLHKSVGYYPRDITAPLKRDLKTFYSSYKIEHLRLAEIISAELQIKCMKGII